jgi:predicted esterase
MRKLLVLLVLAGTAYGSEALEKGKVVERIEVVKDPGVSYAYYLPTNYSTERTWPTLFVFDPRARGKFAAELFQEAAEEFGWIIVSSNDTRSDSTIDPNVRALNGMWPDVNQRFSVDRRRTYATGFSGGAILAWWLAEGTKSLAGVIGVGGRVNGPEKIKEVPFAWFGIAGNTDFNYIETRDIEDRLEAIGATRRFEVFEGGHRWAPKDLLRKSIEWMEIDAMRRKTRAADASIIARSFEDDAVRAEASADELLALHRYESMVRTFDGLTDVTPIRARIAAIQNSPKLRLARDDEKRALALERTHRNRLPSVLKWFLSESEVHGAPAVAHELQIRRLQDLAKDKSRTGVAAQRILESIHVQFGYYLQQQVTGPKLAVSRTIAKMIHPDAK